MLVVRPKKSPTKWKPLPINNTESAMLSDRIFNPRSALGSVAPRSLSNAEEIIATAKATSKSPLPNDAPILGKKS